MSSFLLTPQAQVTNDSGQIAPEEKVSVTNPIDLVTVDSADSGGKASLFVSSIGKDEPIVTRRELWSYYRQSSIFISRVRLLSYLKVFFEVYYNGNNVYSVFFLFPGSFKLKICSIEGSWAERIYYGFVPIVSHRSRIRPCTRATFILRYIWSMCSSLGRRD